MSQIALPLAYRSTGGEADFYVSDANRAAVDALGAWRDWPGRAAVLTGPPASGKSHLARLAAARAAGAIEVADDADRPDRDETALFHAWNRAQAGGPALLLVAETPPAAWDIALPDLRSRLLAAPVLRIHPPDDALLAELLAKGFRSRGLLVSPDVIAYMGQRIERSYAAIGAAVAAVDSAALERLRPITVPLVRAALFGHGTEE